MEEFIYFILNSLTIVSCLFNPLIYPLKKRHFLYLFIVDFLINCLFLNWLGNWTAYISLLVLTAMIYFLSQRKLMNIFSSLSGYIMSILLDYILLTVAQYILKIPPQQLGTQYLLAFSILFLILTFMLTKSAGHFFRYLRGMHNENASGYFLKSITVELFLSIVIIILNFSIGEIYHYPGHIILLNSILFFLYFITNIILLFMVYRTIQKDERLRMELAYKDSLNIYTEKLEAINQDYRSFKHDYSNILYSLRGFIDNDQMEDLRSWFYDNILKTGEAINSSDHQLERLSSIKLLSLKGFLYAKLACVYTYGLNLHLEVDQDINLICMDEIDLIRVLGVFVDNAIEAAVETPEKNLSLILINMEDYVAIHIGNSKLPSTFNAMDTTAPGYTTKGEGHGIGLVNVRKILQKYTNIQLSTIDEPEEYTQLLKIFRRTKHA